MQPTDGLWATLLIFFGDLAVRVAVSIFVLLRSRGTPAVRLAWIVVVLAVPLIGAVLYLLVGEIRLGGKLRKHRRIIDQVATLWRAEPRAPGDEVFIDDEEHRKGAVLIERVGGMPRCSGNRLRLLSNPAETIDTLVADIDGATASCHLLFYIYLDDATGVRVAEALKRAAEREVACRLLVDAIGSQLFLKSKLAQELRGAGVEVAAALPVNPVRALAARLDHRNHRKIAVIDGRIGWTGSQNLADPSFAIKSRFAPWIDLMVRAEGPVVHDLQRIFVEDWLLERHDDISQLLTPRPEPLPNGVAVQVVGSGPCADTEAIKDLTLLSVLESDREILITTPYFVPDVAIASALATIARSGVRTVLVVPKRNDSPLVARASRSYYEPLLRAGLELYEFPHGLLHAKTFTFDGTLSLVATANLDRRSFELNYEISMVVDDPGFTQSLRDLQCSYIEQSERVSLERWLERGWRAKLIESASGVLAPLL